MQPARVRLIRFVRPVAWSRLATAAAVLLAVCAQNVGATSGSGSPATAVEIARLMDRTDGGDVALGWATPEGIDAAAVRRVYAAGGDRAIWLSAAGAPARELLAVLRGAARRGLVPGDYGADRLTRALDGIDRRGPSARARLELDLTAAFLHYAGDLRHGRTALRPNGPGAKQVDPTALLSGVRASSAVDVELAALAPRHAGYRALARQLAQHLAIQAAGGWPTVPDGRALAEGDSGSRVAVLTRRLAASGDLPGYRPEPDRFDAALSAAVRRFQGRHGLVVDGIVAARTLAALNVSAGERAAQIALNLERLRWHRPVGGPAVQVNVPGFRLTLFDDGRPVLRARTVVGMPARPTPVFADRITHLVFNPTWTVPQSIARTDLLPRIRRDPGYLARADMHVFAGWSAGSAPLHPAAVNWDRVAGRLDSYRLVQAPGPDNPLGRVEFMFPNRHNVYIHDTPDTGLFAHARRTYSSGCIRIDRPMALARALLAGTESWDTARIDRAVASGRTVHARLDAPVPVRLVYRTAWIDSDGTLQFRPDIYGRDVALARRLQGVGGAS